MRCHRIRNTMLPHVLDPGREVVVQHEDIHFLLSVCFSSLEQLQWNGVLGSPCRKGNHQPNQVSVLFKVGADDGLSPFKHTLFPKNRCDETRCCFLISRCRHRSVNQMLNNLKRPGRTLLSSRMCCLARSTGTLDLHAPFLQPTTIPALGADELLVSKRIKLSRQNLCTSRCPEDLAVRSLLLRRDSNETTSWNLSVQTQSVETNRTFFQNTNLESLQRLTLIRTRDREPQEPPESTTTCGCSRNPSRGTG